MTGSVRFSLRIQEEQLNSIKELAEHCHSTVGDIIRDSCKQYCTRAAGIKISERILKNSIPGDVCQINFPGSWNTESKNKIKVYVHETAFSDVKNLGKKIEDDVMEFIHSSVSDGSILHKGQITTTDKGINIICFRVNVAHVYCHFSPMQITVLHITK